MQRGMRININMRCIEIYSKYAKHTKIGRININMRCIEIWQGSSSMIHYSKININMRCIEMITKQDIFEMYPD